MTRRSTVSVLALLFVVSVCTTLYGQATPATQAAATPVSQARWVTPMKGEGTVEVVKSRPRRVGNDMVTTLKIKNTSKGALALLTVDEYWYPATSSVTISGDTQRHRALLPPGEIVEITTRSPWKADMARNLFMFKHAHGAIKAKEVAKFVGPK